MCSSHKLFLKGGKYISPVRAASKYQKDINHPYHQSLRIQLKKKKL